MDLRAAAQTEAHRHRSTSEMVADGLREWIMTGALKPGQPLRQTRVAEQFGVSQIPAREALRQLEGEGLVVIYPRRGAVVTELSSQEIWETCAIRKSLEALAMRLAIPNMTSQDLSSAEQILDRIDQETEIAEHWGEMNREFHLALYAPAGASRLQNMIRTLHTNFDRYLRIHLSIMNYRERGQQEHREILERCQNGDVEGAVSTLERHIDNVSEMLLAYLGEEGEEGRR